MSRIFARRRSSPIVGRARRPGSSERFTLERLEERTLLATFSNPAPITINDAAVASPYPSEIMVSGFPAGSAIGKVTVDIVNFSHSFPDDVDMLLVGPDGQNAIIWSDVGGSTDVLAASPATITLDDDAALGLPDISQLVSGTFRPTNFGVGDAFPASAPMPDGGSALSVFNGTSPNGNWRLFVVDDSGGDAGEIAGGWQLNITTYNLSITKTASTDVVIAGEELFYNIHVENDGPSTAASVVVTDTLPAGVGFLGDTAITNPAGGCTAAMGDPTVLTCNLGDIPAGQSRDFKIKVRIPADFVAMEDDGTRTIINTATVSSSMSDSDFSDNSASVATFVEEKADLRITKFTEPSNSVLAGEVVAYTIWVDNLGPSVARNVVISDTFLSSDNAQIQSCAFSVSQGGGLVTQFKCTTGPVVSTQFGTDIGKFGTNFLVPTASIPDPADPMETLVVGRLRASFRLLMKGVEGSASGTHQTSLDLTNTSRAISDTPDPDTSNNFAVSELRVVHAADLALTTMATAEEQQVAQAGLMFNNAIFGQAFPTAPNYFASTRVTAGRRIQYRLNVTNNGPSKAYNVVVTDLLPPNVRLYQGSLSATKGTGALEVPVACDGGTAGEPLDRIVCGIGTLDPVQTPAGAFDRSTATIIFEVIVDASTPAGAVLLNEANVTSDAFELDNGDNYAHTENTVLAAADLSVSKSSVGENVTGYSATLDRLLENDVASAVTAGKVLRYEIAVQNNGPSDSQNVTISDALPSTPLPGPVTFLRADGAVCRPSAVDNDTLSCDLGTLAAGDRRTFDIYVLVDPSVPATTVLANCATALTGASNTIPPGGPPALPTGGPTQSLTFDPLTSNNTNVCTNTTVNASADLAITKTAEPPKLLPGEELSFHIRVENLGPSAAANVIVTDTLPLGVKFEFDTDNCTLTSTDPDVVTCSLGTLQPGEVVEFDIIAEVTAATPSGVELCNVAVVSSDTIDFNLTNNTATACNFTIPGANLSVTKEAPATVNPGTNITYTITVSNSGPTSAIDVVLEDFIPAEERTLSVTPSVGSCLAGVAGDADRPTTCNLDTLAAGESATITVVVEVDNCAHDLNELFNDVQVSSKTFDPDNSDNVFHSTTEVRQSANGNVTAVASRGNLSIVGDNFNNTIRIDSPAEADPHALRITPFGGTKVNGECRSVQVHGVKGNVSVRMGRANDTVLFDGPIRLRKSLKMLLGQGNDTVSLSDMTVRGITSIRVDGDSDVISVIDSVLDSLSIRTGKLGDSILLDGTHVLGTTTIRSDGSIDIVRIVDSIFDDGVLIQGGRDSDTLDIGILSNPNANGNDFNATLNTKGFENVIS